MGENREHRRIRKNITMKVSRPDLVPRHWDMTIVENISAGGVKFTASSEQELSNREIDLQIKIPQLSPIVLELKAMVLTAQPRMNGKTVEVRAKFINLSPEDINRLSIIEKMIDSQK